MENKEPLVSIISGYYNRENLVDHSIKSLINQTYKNTEIIVFDDCSTDNTYNELKKYTHIERLKLIRHDVNKGFVQGLIDAIKIAKGEYIAIHGSGDISFKERIEKQVSYLNSNKNVSVVGCYYHNSKNGEIVNTYKNPSNKDFYKTVTSRSVFSHGEVMFRKSIYEKVGGYRTFFTFAQDRDLWCRMSLISDYYVIKEVLYERCNDAQNAVKNNIMKLAKQTLLSDFAIQSIKMRKEVGFDFIDIVGNQALAYRKKTANVSNRIAHLAFKEYKLKNWDNFNKLYSLLKCERNTIRKLLIILVKTKIINIAFLAVLSKSKKSVF